MAMQEFARPAEIINLDDFRKRTLHARGVQSESGSPIFTWPEYSAGCRETSAGIEARIGEALKGDERTKVQLCSIMPNQQTCFALDENGAETKQAILLADFLDTMFTQMISYGFDKGLQISDKKSGLSADITLIYPSPTHPLQFVSRVNFINEDERQIEWFVRKDKPLAGLRRLK